MKLTLLEVKTSYHAIPPQTRRLIEYLESLKLGEVVTADTLAAVGKTTINYVHNNARYLKDHRRLHGKRNYYGSKATMKQFDKEILNGNK